MSKRCKTPGCNEYSYIKNSRLCHGCWMRHMHRLTAESKPAARRSLWAAVKNCETRQAAEDAIVNWVMGASVMFRGWSVTHVSRDAMKWAKTLPDTAPD